jgi:disulfide oxidoreductase YuzD
LKAQYGEAVEIEHLDLQDPENGVRFGDMLAIAEEQNLQYPLVAVNGQLRLAGSAQYYHVLPLVQEALAED